MNALHLHSTSHTDPYPAASTHTNTHASERALACISKSLAIRLPIQRQLLLLLVPMSHCDRTQEIISGHSQRREIHSQLTHTGHRPNETNKRNRKHELKIKCKKMCRRWKRNERTSNERTKKKRLNEMSAVWKLISSVWCEVFSCFCFRFFIFVHFICAIRSWLPLRMRPNVFVLSKYSNGKKCVRPRWIDCMDFFDVFGVSECERARAFHTTFRFNIKINSKFVNSFILIRRECISKMHETNERDTRQYRAAMVGRRNYDKTHMDWIDI